MFIFYVLQHSQTFPKRIRFAQLENNPFLCSKTELMTEDELRDRIYEYAGTLEADEVLKVNIDGYKCILTNDSILVRLGEEWMSLARILDAMTGN